MGKNQRKRPRIGTRVRVFVPGCNGGLGTIVGYGSSKFAVCRVRYDEGERAGQYGYLCEGAICGFKRLVERAELEG